MSRTQTSDEGPAREKQRRRKRRTARLVIESLAAPTVSILVLAIWQFGAPLLGLSVFILPTPSQIIQRIGSDFRLLMTHSFITLLETLAGFFIASVCGVATAFAIFYSRIFERAFYPLLVAMQTIPKVALAPLLVLYLGYDFAPKCFLAFLLAYFPIVIATVVGLQALDKGMVDLVRSMGANEWQTFLKTPPTCGAAQHFWRSQGRHQPGGDRCGHRRIRRGRTWPWVSAAAGQLAV